MSKKQGVRNCLRICWAHFGIFVGFPVLSVFLAICSILELEAFDGICNILVLELFMLHSKLEGLFRVGLGFI